MIPMFKKIEDYITEKYDQIALDHLKRQTLTEVTQETKEYNISRSNTSSTPDTI